MKKRWVKDYCPYAKDQNFLSVVGDVILGETVFGFTHTLTGADDDIVFKTDTSSRVTQMKDLKYRVAVTRVTGLSTATAAPIVSLKTKTGFHLDGVTSQTYDVVVIGKVAY